jgi:hypothetical protein
MDGTTQHLSAYLPTYLPLYTAATRQLKENSGVGKSSDQRRKFPRCMYAARVRPMPYLLQTGQRREPGLPACSFTVMILRVLPARLPGELRAEKDE